MIKSSAQHPARKVIVSLCLALLLCCTAFSAPAPGAQPTQGGRNYVVTPDAYRDTYILTQLFYSAFSVNDLTPMQHVASQGMLAYPDDFRRFMALCMELLKTSDTRLFMLLAPLAPHMADRTQPADIESVIRLTNIISGRSLPGVGQPEEPSLKSRIKFYEDNSRVLRRPAPEAEPPVPGANDPAAGQPQNAPAYIAADAESFSFTRSNGSTQANWTRDGSGGQKITSRAVSSVLEDGSVWGGVYTNFSGQSDTELAFFVVRDDIISFALPKGVSEGNFYADEEPRPHQTAALDPDMFARRPDGAVPRPCEMRVVISPLDDAMPPELSLRLEQNNAGRGVSDFICRPQCVLTYTWDENGYVLSGKSCMESGWGVWPHSDESYRRPAPANRANTQTRSAQ